MRVQWGVWCLLGGLVAFAAGCAPAPTISATSTPSVTEPGPAATAVLPPTATWGIAAPGEVLFEDPVVEEIYDLARSDLAERLGVSRDDVTLVEWAAVTWPDGSVGCPQAGQGYDPGEVAGYRLVLAATGQSYYYHADYQSVIYCDAASEVLP
ncbi:MAG: hypothetical protein JXB47_08025 [Anaerolineae bacterium]|nr:hypothetical protein [Anaerolineae bacterium]